MHKYSASKLSTHNGVPWVYVNKHATLSVLAEDDELSPHAVNAIEIHRIAEKVISFFIFFEEGNIKDFLNNQENFYLQIEM